ncbi:hypothetical protein [Bradyrhizobium neotropicale]|uniref:hypothetical protein n=1 Tax=Bradyrhizobium neotropicale TaxID=1497615 RepID=UPI001AD70B73|nr:hypothetical protein [Bradyrhizobium neotropicale]MBO4225234.1 hypothetical protein [Bradyrhizobium neotropicale]
MRTGIESIQPLKAFQAEYEGSIPFTRSIARHQKSRQNNALHVLSHTVKSAGGVAIGLSENGSGAEILGSTFAGLA